MTRVPIVLSTHVKDHCEQSLFSLFCFIFYYTGKYFSVQSICTVRKGSACRVGVFTRKFSSQLFFLTFYCSQVMSYMCQKCKTSCGSTNFISEMKHVENYQYFEKLTCVHQHGLQGFYLKDVHANCFCASLLRTLNHMPRHTLSECGKF